MTRPPPPSYSLSTSRLLVLAVCFASAVLARKHHDGPPAGFVPKKWPAIVGIVLYSISAAVHWYWWYKLGKRYMLTLTIGMSCIVLGFIFRIVYSNNADSLGLYILTTLFILLSPCAFLATDYVILHHMSLALEPKAARDALFLAPTKIVKGFVISDVVTFLLQAAGGGLSVQPSAAAAGKNIALIGLVLQLVSFSLFTCLLLVFGWRVDSRYPLQWQSNPQGKDMRIIFFATLSTCIGIIIRSVFRIVEYSGGYTGFVAIHEGYFYFLDALPLWLAMSVYCVLWPPKFIHELEPKQTSDDGELGTPGETGTTYELTEAAGVGGK